MYISLSLRQYSIGCGCTVAYNSSTEAGWTLSIISWILGKKG